MVNLIVLNPLDVFQLLMPKRKAISIDDWIPVTYTDLQGNRYEGYVRTVNDPGRRLWNRQLYIRNDDGEYIPLLKDRFPLWILPTMLIGKDGSPIETYQEETISTKDR